MLTYYIVKIQRTMVYPLSYFDARRSFAEHAVATMDQVLPGPVFTAVGNLIDFVYSLEPYVAPTNFLGE